MSFLDSYFNSDENLPIENQNIDDEILRVKEIVEQGNIYSVIESIEEDLKICI